MKKENKINRFDVTVDSFLNNIESLRSTLPTILGILQIQNGNAIKAHQKFLNEECEYIKTEDHFIIQPDQTRKNTKLKKAATNSTLARKIVARNFIVSLVSQFDTYIGELMRCVFELRPDIVDTSDRQLSYTDLRAFKTIEDARNYIIEKEIESVLRDSHSEQFNWFERKLGLKLRKDLPAWKGFIELTQRRNLFVHNDGKVSAQYLAVCKDHKIAIDEKIKIGTTLNVNPEYFENAFSCLFEIGLKLNQVIRRNLIPEELESADESFMNITFELIHNKQYDLAKVMFEFEDKYINKYSNQDTELRILLNRAQTYKWLGDEETCKQIIESRDWSACGELFKLASSVLIDDFKSAAASMKIIGNNDDIITKGAYSDWPVFQKFIKSKEFSEAFNEIYQNGIGLKEDGKTPHNNGYE